MFNGSHMMFFRLSFCTASSRCSATWVWGCQDRPTLEENFHGKIPKSSGNSYEQKVKILIRRFFWWNLNAFHETSSFSVKSIFSLGNILKQNATDLNVELVGCFGTRLTVGLKIMVDIYLPRWISQPMVITPPSQAIPFQSGASQKNAHPVRLVGWSLPVFMFVGWLFDFFDLICIYIYIFNGLV